MSKLRTLGHFFHVIDLRGQLNWPFLLLGGVIAFFCYSPTYLASGVLALALANLAFYSFYSDKSILQLEKDFAEVRELAEETQKIADKALDMANKTNLSVAYGPGGVK